MNCFVENCQEKPMLISVIGAICQTHNLMIPQEHSDKLQRRCMECNQSDCVHIKSGIIGEKIASDGMPETLGISVGESIKAGDRIG